jgi:hypothetical protein
MWKLYFGNKYRDRNLAIEIYEDKYDGWSITVYQKDKINNPKPEFPPEW